MQAHTKKRHSNEPHIYENGIQTDCEDKRTTLGILVWQLVFIILQDLGMMMMMMMISIGLLQASSINKKYDTCLLLGRYTEPLLVYSNYCSTL